MIIFNNDIFNDGALTEGMSVVSEAGLSSNGVNEMLINVVNEVSDTKASVLKSKAGIVRMAGFISGHVYDAELTFPNHVSLKFNIPFEKNYTNRTPFGKECDKKLNNVVRSIVNTMEKRLVKAGMENCEVNAYDFRRDRTMVQLHVYTKPWRNLDQYEFEDFGANGREIMGKK